MAVASARRAVAACFGGGLAGSRVLDVDLELRHGGHGGVAGRFGAGRIRRAVETTVATPAGWLLG
jgi:hypothetical protein